MTYEIPADVADDRFRIDRTRGIVTTNGQFDRENKDFFTVPIYVTDSAALNGYRNSASNPNYVYGTEFDVATLVVKVTDVNDHAPEFRSGSCYPLAVPENSPAAIIHTVVATDLDEGPNGDIIYSITGEFNCFIAFLMCVSCSFCLVLFFCLKT